MQTPKLPDLGEVVAIQAFMPSSEHIRNQSVMAIETLEDINSGKFGVTDWCTACLSCDGFLEDCPGHFGHLELPIPAYRVFFMHHLIEIMSCICYWCQSCRLPKTDPKYAWIKSLDPELRLVNLVKVCEPYKRCGREQDTSQLSRNYNTCCGKLFVKFSTEDRDAVFVKAVIPLDLQDFAEWKRDPTWQAPTISPQNMLDCLSLISEETKSLLGCIDNLNEPSACMWEVLPTPSHNTRPAHTFGSLGTKKKSFNDWTKLTRFIVSARNELRAAMEKAPDEIPNIAWYSVNGVIAKNANLCFTHGYLEKKLRDKAKKDLKKQQPVHGPVELAWRSLNKQIAAFHSHKHKKFANKGSVYGKPPLGVESRYKGQKLARFRCNVIARRVENAMRGVLEGEMRMRPDQIIVPQQEAMNCTFPEYVTKFNLEQAHRWIMNGPYTYPGANYVVMKNGQEIDLANYENRRDIKLDDVLKIKRHILDGDLLLVNRQPTLHRMSIFCLFALVKPIFVFRIHYCVFQCLAADCDGDEMVVHVPQTEESKAEMRVICSVENCIMKDGKIWVNFIQNAVVGAYLMTRPGLKFDKQSMCDLVSELDVWEFPEPDLMGEYTGHQIISLLLPPDFTMENNGIVIHNGRFVSGQLNENSLNGRHSILSHMYRDYHEKEIVIQFLYQGYLLFQKYIDQFGLSGGYYDCAIDPRDEMRFGAEAEPDYKDEYCRKMCAVFAELRETDRNVQRLREYSDQFPHHNPAHGNPEIEENIKEHIEKINKQSCDAINAYHVLKDRTNSNGILHAILSGAKGSTSTLNSMGGKVGQVFVIYKRFGCTSSHFQEGHNTLGAFGFINENYATGISLPCVMIEAHAACESVVNKNKGTSKSGYTVRKLTTCMMGVVIDRQGRAVDTNGRVIWNKYGNDGFDSQVLTKTRNRELQIVENGSDEQVHLRMLHNNAKACKKEFLACFDFVHLFLRCKLKFLRCSSSIAKILEPVDYFRFVNALWYKLVEENLVSDAHANLKLMFFDWLGSDNMLSMAFGYEQMMWLGNTIRAYHERACIQPGESVGTLATQNMGEPFSQMSLKTPHLSGKFRGLFSGTVRIANMVDSNFANPTMSVVLKKRVKTHQEAVLFGLSILRCTLDSISLSYPHFELKSTFACFHFDLDKLETVKRLVSVREIARNLAINSNGLDLDNFRCSFADADRYWLEMDVSYQSKLWLGIIKVMSMKRAPISDNRAIADVIAHNFYSNVVVHGFPEIENFVVDQNEDKRFVVTTLGSSFAKVLTLPGVDSLRSTCNNCIEMCNVLGIQAARKSVEYEFCNVFKGVADERHIKLVSRVMASDLEIKGMKISQAAQNIPMLQRASYEQGPKQMSEYCANAEVDFAQTICGASLSNKLMNVGTGFCLDVLPMSDVHMPTLRMLHPTQVCDYCFSFKVSGLRTMLVFSHDRNNSKLCNLTARNNTVYTLPTGGLVPDALFSGTVLDGDLVRCSQSINNDDTKYSQSIESKMCFVVHDVLMSCGNVCSTLRYDQRIEIAREVVHRLATFNLANDCRQARNFSNVDMGMKHAIASVRPNVSCMMFQPGSFPFLITVKPIFDLSRFEQFRQTTLPFPTDGYVLTSLSLGAYPFRNKPESVFKVKPPECSTIDVVIRSTDSGLTYADITGVDAFRTDGDLYMCAINDFNEVSSLAVFAKMPKHADTVEGSVYECGWHNNQWKILLKRDKAPNTLSTIVKTIRNIIDEIKLSDLID